jgi:dTDP-4-dehydrorhamnose reductase
MIPVILILGAQGQLGWQLQRALAPIGNLFIYDRSTCNISDADALACIIEVSQPDIIVNAAAFTAVDRAETEQEAAYAANSNAVAVMAKIAANRNALLIHYSTDYVFDGTKNSAYNENDAPNPLSVYGASKREGELAIIKSGCKYLIFRTSWVFATRGNNFAKTMLRLAASHDTLRVVADQWGAPTSAELIADITAHAIRYMKPELSGIYHLAASGETNWHQYAKFVIEHAATMGAAIKTTTIEPITTAEYPLPAKRPANSRLDCSKLQSTFNLVLPPWQYHVERMLVELFGK